MDALSVSHSMAALTADAARAADAAFVACDAVLKEASSSLVDGEPVVQGVRCRARISY